MDGSELPLDRAGDNSQLANGKSAASLTVVIPDSTSGTFDFSVSAFCLRESRANEKTEGADTALRPFRSHGGKLIQYHGWSDPDIPPTNSIHYFESVVESVAGKHSSGLQETREFYRLFMVPGMLHCTGGPGTSRFDALIENFLAPDRGVGTPRFDAVGKK